MNTKQFELLNILQISNCKWQKTYLYNVASIKNKKKKKNRGMSKRIKSSSKFVYKIVKGTPNSRLNSKRSKINANFEQAMIEFIA